MATPARTSIVRRRWCCKRNDLVRRMVKGFMVESYLEPGCQKIGDGVYGKSITDKCLSWNTTEQLLRELAHAVAARRWK